MKKIFKYGIFILSIILFFSSAILLFDIPRVDDIPYNKVIRDNVVSLSDFNDFDNNDNVVSFSGFNVAYSNIDLTQGQSVVVKYTLNNPSQEQIGVFVDLYNHEENYDIPLVEDQIIVDADGGTFVTELAYSRQDHPDFASLRFFSSNEAYFIEISDIEVSIVEKVKDGNIAVKVLTVLDIIVLALSFAYIVGYIIVNRKEYDKSLFEKTKLRDGIILYGGIILSVAAVLAFIYRNADIRYPLEYAGGDEIGVFYVVKAIKEFGYTLINPREGGITGADMFDYPYSDKFSFIIVKFISLFFDNVYLIANLFYFTSYLLIALITCRVCRSLGCGKRISYMIAVLYAFSPFMQLRYEHMWLTPYYMLPVACMIAIRILNDDIDVKSRRFMTYVLLSFGCAFTGMYYAWFTCAVIAAAIAIRLFSSAKKDIPNVLKYTAYIFSCAAGVAVNVLPNAVYCYINGFSSSTEMSLRSSGHTEYYGLKLVQMLLPREGHRIAAFSDMAQNYADSFPLVNENISASLGIIASVGLILALINLLSKKESLAESKLITSVFLISTIGGIGTILSLFVSLPMRCYNRASLMIMFMALLLIGRYISTFIDKLSVSAGSVLIGAMVCLGILDQTVDFVKPDYLDFEASQKLVHQIEDTLDEGDMVFVLPVLDWPSQPGYMNHIGYTESKSLRWSYGAAQGRTETVWQHKVAGLDCSQMISVMRNAGYDGIYLDVWLYGVDASAELSSEITDVVGASPMISDDGRLYFWDIRE